MDTITITTEESPVFKNPEKGNLVSLFIGITANSGEFQSRVVCSFKKRIATAKLEEVKSGMCDQSNSVYLTTQSSGGLVEDEEFINHLDVFNHNFALITNNAECQLYKLRPLKFVRTLSRKPGTRVAAFASTGLVAIGSDEADIILTCVYRAEYARTLSGHKNGVKSLAFNAEGGCLASSSADGTVKVWVGSKESDAPTWKCIHTFDDVIGTSVPENKADVYPLTWSPNGDFLAVAGLGGAVHLIKNATWVVKHTFHHDTVSTVVSKIQFSPNGLYLMCLDNAGGIYIWSTTSFDVKEGLIALKTHDHRVCDAKWDPVQNAIVVIDASGSIVYIPELLESPRHPVTEILARDATQEGPEQEEEDLFGEDFNDVSLFDIVATEDNEVEKEDAAEEDHFVVDDDGAGYLEDLRIDENVQKYNERTKNESLKKLARDFPDADEEPLIHDRLETRLVEAEIQPSFQSGSALAKNNRHYLCYNMVGTICIISSTSEKDQFVVDVSFHDASLRPFHFTHHVKFHVATVGSTGAIFASAATTVLPSEVFYRPMNSWGSKNEWSVSLPSGENVLAVAVSNYCCAVATDANYLRLYTPSGVQTGIRSIPGPIVTIIGSEEHIIVVYHEGGVFHGNQTLAYFVIDSASGTLVYKDKLPVSPLSTLAWLGFSNSGVPLSFDSNGILRALFMHSDYTWTPIFDSSAFRGEKEETYWPMGCSDTEFQAVICRGIKDPIHPKPLINDLPLLIPFCGVDTEQGKLEEKAARMKLNLAHVRSSKLFGENVRDISQREIDLDKIMISMIMMACKTEQTQRALDLGSFLYSIRSIDGAIKLASYNHLTTLAERLIALKELKMKENDEITRGNGYYPSEPSVSVNYAPSLPPAVSQFFPPPIDSGANNHTLFEKEENYDFSPIGEDAVDNSETQSQIFDSTQIESAQRPPVQAKQDVPKISRPAKKSNNPFAAKPKKTTFGSKVSLGGGETIFDAIAKESAASAKESSASVPAGKRKQKDMKGVFVTDEAIKKMKAAHQQTKAVAGPSNAPSAPVDRKIDSIFAAIPNKQDAGPKDIPAEVVEDTEEMVVDTIPNKSIVPPNESEEEKKQRLAIENMFGDKENSPTSNINIDRKGKGLMYPSESLKAISANPLPSTEAS